MHRLTWIVVWKDARLSRKPEGQIWQVALGEYQASLASQSKVVHHFHNPSNSIRCGQNVPHILLYTQLCIYEQRGTYSKIMNKRNTLFYKNISLILFSWIPLQAVSSVTSEMPWSAACPLLDSDSLPLSKSDCVILITWSPSSYRPVRPDCPDALSSPCLLITT